MRRTSIDFKLYARPLPGIYTMFAVRSALACACLMACAALTANAWAAEPADTPTDVRHERNSYYLRLLTQVFDGNREFSHSQVASFARVRYGDESFSMIDFDRGSVVIEQADGLAATPFINTTGPEQAFHYDYQTKMIVSGGPVADFHNTFVRPHLDQGPPLGSDAQWSVTLPLSAFDVAVEGDPELTIELERVYFTHEGEDYALVRYNVPAFQYVNPDVGTVVQWGRGVSLTDPGFGEVYWNASLHRAVSDEGMHRPRPYRMLRTIAGIDRDNRPLIDLRTVPQLQDDYERFYSPAHTAPLPFEQTQAQASPLPVTLAGNVDVLALSLGENGANQAPELNSAVNNGPRGNEQPVNSPTTLERAEFASSLLEDSAWGLDKISGMGNYVIELEQAFQDIVEEGRMLSNRLERTAQNLAAVEQALIDDGKMIVDLKPGTKLAQQRMDAAANALGNAEGNLEFIEDQIEHFRRPDGSVPQDLLNQYSTAQKDVIITRGRYDDAQSAFQTALRSSSGGAELMLDLSDPTTARLAESSIRLSEEIGEVQRALDAYTKRTAGLGDATRRLLESLPAEQLARVADGLQAFADSPAGKVLEFVSHGLNVYETGSAGYNAYRAGTQDQSSGQLNLTRSYTTKDGNTSWGDVGAITMLGLDLLALGGNAVSGNVPGVISDATAITAGSLSDLFVAAKGYTDTLDLVTATYAQGAELQRRHTEQIAKIEAAKLAELQATPYGLDALTDDVDPYADGYDTSDPRIDQETGLPKPGYWAYLKENDPQALEQMGIDPNAPVGGWPTEEQIGNTPGATPGDELTDEEHMQRIADAIEDESDYPRAQPRDPAGDDEAAADVSDGEPMLSEIPDWLEEQWAEDEKRRQQEEELHEIQQELLAEREQEREDWNPGQPFEVSDFETSPLEISPLDIKPVDFEMPEFEAPEFENPEFEAPDFEFDDFELPPTSDLTLRPMGNDEDWMTEINNPAFQNMNLTDFSISGTVEIDLAPWEAWLATQNVRQLERWAIAAGFPNLASALARAPYLISLALDDGFRQWAMSMPPGHGYTGVTTYWTDLQRRRALLALGDVLADSREYFSTGGLSDVAISGLRLQYTLRDTGVQDNDIVEIRVRQYGQDIFTTRLSLLNAGSDFDHQVQRGVALLSITAINEGTIPPNTAGVELKNVVEGNGNQSYSLRTGETATLRVEAGR